MSGFRDFKVGLRYLFINEIKQREIVVFLVEFLATCLLNFIQLTFNFDEILSFTNNQRVPNYNFWKNWHFKKLP